MMVFFLAMMQWSHMFFVHQTLQHAVREAGRQALVGQTNVGGVAHATVEAAARQILCNSSLGLLPSPNARILFTNRSTTNQDFGGANATFTIRVEYRYGYHTPLVGFYNALFGGHNNFNNGSNLIVSSTFVSEKYNDDFL
jgi:hypothetical protein